METLDRLNNVRRAWNLASDKGYFTQAIIDYTAPDFVNMILQLLPGLLAALAIPILGQIGGTAAGTAVGVLITAVTGQAEVVPITANIGRIIGALAADAVLIYLGLMFIKEYILPRLGQVGEHVGKGCSMAYNAPPEAGDRMLDAAAKEIAEGVGFLLGLVLLGIVMYLSKGPTERLVKMRTSFLGRTCPKVMEWVNTNLTWLVERYKAGPTKIPGGARPPVVPATPGYLTEVTDAMLVGGAVGEANAFRDFPTPIEGKSLGTLLPLLQKLGFRWVQVTTRDALGRTVQSNIYFRVDALGRFTGEAIRIDPRGHAVGPNIPKVGTVKHALVNEKVAYGEVRHIHKAYIEPATARRYLGGYDPSLPVTEFNDYNQPIQRGTMSRDDAAGYGHIWVKP